MKIGKLSKIEWILTGLGLMNVTFFGCADYNLTKKIINRNNNVVEADIIHRINISNLPQSFSYHYDSKLNKYSIKFN